MCVCSIVTKKKLHIRFFRNYKLYYKKSGEETKNLKKILTIIVCQVQKREEIGL